MTVARPVGTAPVVVLAPAYCGAGELRSVLAGHPALACTSGTGLLPLCQQAMATWRNADGRLADPPSSLACTATRTLAASVITSILAREGKPRWCEVAAANPEAAETFLRLFPGTRFLCLYRAWPGAIRAALDASPWGITDSAFAPFVRAYPASTVASLTAYWVTHTGALLAFDRAHPQACLRVRFEDLIQDQPQALERVTSFLGLTGTDFRAVRGGHDQPQPTSVPVADPPDAPVADPPDAPVADPPDHLTPPALRAQANDLLKQLDYPGTRQGHERHAPAAR